MRRSASSSPSSSLQIRLIFLFSIFFIVNVLFLNIALEEQQSRQSNRNILLEQQESPISEEKNRRDPDGIFNGYPVYYYDGGGETTTTTTTTTEDNKKKTGRSKKKYFYSSSHCIGENYQNTENEDSSVSAPSWIYRSCHYTFFCYDLIEQDFVVFQPPDHATDILNSSEILQQRPYIDTSQSWLQPPFGNNYVSLGGDGGRRSINKFSPRIITTGNYPKSIFAFDESVILIPTFFHSSSLFASKAEHSNLISTSSSPRWLLIWEDFLPIYTLMTQFELQDKAILLLHTTSSKNNNTGEKIRCDSSSYIVGKNHRDDDDDDCATLFSMVWPLLRSRRYNNSILTTTRDVEWNVNNVSQSNNNKSASSQYVCSRHGLAGIGDAKDHEMRKVHVHGWEKLKYSEITINHGRRAPVIWSFRQFVMKNIGIQNVPLKLPYRIVLSSSSKEQIQLSTSVIDSLKRNFDPNFAVVTVNDFTRRSKQNNFLEEQLRTASEAAVFIIGCCSDGDDDDDMAAAIAPFVQKGSSIVIYHPRLSTPGEEELAAKMGRLDWDILNNLGYAYVHWLPKEGMAENLETLATLVKSELNRIHEYLG